MVLGIYKEVKKVNVHVCFYLMAQLLKREREDLSPNIKFNRKS